MTPWGVTFKRVGGTSVGYFTCSTSRGKLIWFPFRAIIRKTACIPLFKRYSGSIPSSLAHSSKLEAVTSWQSSSLLSPEGEIEPSSGVILEEMAVSSSSVSILFDGDFISAGVGDV